MSTGIYRDAPWPKTEDDVTATAIIRHALARQFIVCELLLGENSWIPNDPANKVEQERWQELIGEHVAIGGFVRALRMLRKTDKTYADEVALGYWRDCEDGGSVGEFAWEWAVEFGLDPAALQESAKVLVAGEQS